MVVIDRIPRLEGSTPPPCILETSSVEFPMQDTSLRSRGNSIEILIVERKAMNISLLFLAFLLI
ncbi:MAG: hypothetical protein M2R45_02689 [Verrucomicrobia subdivision 3 bacterium]|nr:hypothetical protein [Limisphaerales bacterium]MCS1415031.1 hypothetical protein [Limisphaerales bacterium]